MDIVVKLLFWVHLMSLAAGGAASFGIPVVGSRMPTVAPEMRPTLLAVMKGLSQVGRVGIGLLIITGPLLFWLEYNFSAPAVIWFGIKMALVVLLLIGVIYGGILLKRSTTGDVASAQRMPQVGMINTLLFVAIILAAVFAFD